MFVMSGGLGYHKGMETGLFDSSTSCRNLALGIGIQNFPEGLAVSLPLKASGVDTWRSFWY